MILDKNQILNNLSFVENNTPNGDAYLCACGHKFNIKNENQEIKRELAETNKSVVELMEADNDFQEEFGDLYKNVNLSMEEKVECPSCKKSFLREENRRRLITKGIFFVSGFKFQEIDNDLFFYYCKVKADYNNNDFEFIEKNRYLRVNRETRQLFIKKYDESEVEFSLSDIVDVVNSFFTTETQVVYNAIDLHNFIYALSNLVIDKSNIDIMGDLLSQIKNRHNDLGLDTIKKVVAIFLGIIKYSNLSTLAMTKSPSFLYDIMSECNLPSPQEFAERELTSPLKIFNFLAQNYVLDIGKDINLDNKENKEFSFKSKKMIEFEKVLDEDGNVLRDDTGEEITRAVVKESDQDKTININFSENKSYKTGKVKDTGSGFGVIDAVGDGSVSKFIFKKIKNFSDYKYIIKYFKIVNKQELIVLLQKYDLEFLSHAIDLLYFRDKVNFKELQRILDIMLDFTKEKSKTPGKFDCLGEFEFIPYDDSMMMMEVLKFDKKRHFDKIRTWKELNAYHDNLVKYFKSIRDEERNGDIQGFVSQFSHLESRDNYNGPLRIVLLSTPAMIIREGVELRHSGAAYAKNVASRTYLMGQVFDEDPNKGSGELDRYTIGFKNDKYKGLVFDQVKGFANKLGSDRFKRLVMDWLKAKDISFQPIKDLRIETAE